MATGERQLLQDMFAGGCRERLRESEACQITTAITKRQIINNVDDTKRRSSSDACVSQQALWKVAPMQARISFSKLADPLRATILSMRRSLSLSEPWHPFNDFLAGCDHSRSGVRLSAEIASMVATRLPSKSSWCIRK